jgi:Caspase domain
MDYASSHNMGSPIFVTDSIQSLLMKVTGLIAASVLVLLLFVPAARGTNYAILIGIGDYDQRTFLYPTSGNQDTDALAILRIVGIAPADAQNTQDATLTSTAPFLNDLTANDVLLLYYAGHGGSGPDQNDYLIPSDATDTNDTSQLVALGMIQTAINNTGAGTIVVIVDACRFPLGVTRGGPAVPRWNRGVEAKEGSGKVFELEFPGKRYYTMLAAGQGEYSHEMIPATIKHGVFTNFLLAALNHPELTDLSGPDQCMSLQNLYDYAQNQTRNYVTLKVGANQNAEERQEGGEWANGFCMERPLLAIEDFFISPNSIRAGDNAKLQWSVRHADSVRIEPTISEWFDEHSGDTPLRGAVEITPHLLRGSRTYILTASRGDATSSRSVHLEVTPMTCEVLPKQAG